MNKKIKNLIIIFMLLILPLMFVSNKSFAAEESSAQNKVLKGDINNDGKIDMGDIIQMLRHISAGSNKEWLLSEEKIKFADFNKNDKVDIGDIMTIIRYWAAINNKGIAKENPEWLKLEDEEKQAEAKQEETKKEESKQEETKQEETKQEESKQEETKQEETKQEESKQEETKQEESKQEETKQEESKQEESKKEESKTEENKKEVNKQEESKTEENKKEVNKQKENKQDKKKSTMIKVKQLKFKQNKYQVLKGKTKKILPTITPKDANNKTLSWKSKDPKIASVAKDGTITGKRLGTTTITAEAQDGSNKKATYKITVTQPVTKIKLSKSQVNLTVGDTITLTSTITPQKANNKKLEWKSKNSKIASVDKNGKIKANKKGTTTIIATAADKSGIIATCKVTVKEKEKIDPSVYTNLKLTATELYISVGNSYTIKTTKNIGKVSIDWKSADKNIASVNKNGLVKANKKGNTTITATIGDKKFTCKVHVFNSTIEYYISDTPGQKGKKKLKMFLDNKQLKNVLPSKEKRQYTWKSEKGKIELEGKNEGRPRVKKIKEADKIIAIITDKLADNASGIRIRLRAERKMAKNEKAISEEETHKKEQNAK